MSTRNSFRVALVLGLIGVAGWGLQRPTWGEEEAPQQHDAAKEAASVKIDPKPLNDSTRKGLEYLVSQQRANGGWGQGGGWRTGGQNGGRREGNDVNDPTDLGNTCIAALALIRSGSTPQSGPYANQLARAAEFICGQIQASNVDGLYVTDVRDTQLQRKIGLYVDTFLAGLVLAELKGQMPNPESEKRLLAALDKAVAKIEKNQQEDGTFAGNTGWASVLSQGLCSKFLNGAAQRKVAIRTEVLERDYRQSVAALDQKSGEAKPAATFATGGESSVPSSSALPSRITRTDRGTLVKGGEGGDAGVDLYSRASNAGRIRYFYDTNRQTQQVALQTLNSKSATAEEKQQAKVDLSRVKEVEGAQAAAVQGVVRKLSDEEFIAGFGNNGGEEFLSYMNISEMLVVQGGDEWEKWDKAVSANLAQVQNGDGSWSGHHCITGRTFCTATALLTLMADRAPGQLAAQIQNQKK